jgi:hypothetical protein
MGEDVPAFERSTQRPQDTAAARGDTDLASRLIAVGGGSTRNQTLFTNNGSSPVFVEVINVSQVLASGVGVQSDVLLTIFLTASGFGIDAGIQETGGSFTQTVPSLPVTPGESIQLQVKNESTQAIEVQAFVTIRES